MIFLWVALLTVAWQMDLPRGVWLTLAVCCGLHIIAVNIKALTSKEKP